MTFRTFMDVALTEARAAATRGEVPVGAVIVNADGVILAQAGNRTRELNDPSAHAEMLVIREACAKLGVERLENADLYITLEPCTMCCGALVHARVGRLVFATREPRAGAVLSTGGILDNPALNHRVEWVAGLYETESADLLRQFFQQRRGDQEKGT